VSKSRADLGLVRKLFALGRDAGQNWLAAHREDVGRRASMQIAENI
jgi:NTE family protein